MLSFPEKVVEQTISRKQSAIKRQWAKSEQKIKSNTKTSNPRISDQQIKYWSQYFSELDAHCKQINQEYFADKNYIDPEAEHYKNPEEILQRVKDVFNNALDRDGSKPFFALMKRSLDDCEEKEIFKFKNVFTEAEICREYESFYFLETVFEASVQQNYSEEYLRILHDLIISMASNLLDDQATLENSLFVLSILKKIPHQWRPLDDSRVVDEVAAYYEEVIEKWKDYGSDMLDIEQSDACGYFHDYFNEVEEVNRRTLEMIEDLRRY